MVVAGFRQGLGELERVRVTIGGRCLGQLEEELEGEMFANRPMGNPDSDVELQEVVGRFVETLGEEGAVGGVGWTGMRHSVKKSPVGSSLFEGEASVYTSRPGKMEEFDSGGRVKEEMGRVDDWCCGNGWNGIPGVVERGTSSSEGSRMFDFVKIPNPFQAILGVGRRLSVENTDSVVAFLVCLVLMKSRVGILGWLSGKCYRCYARLR